MANPLAEALGRRVHYGWVVAAVTFLTMLVTAAAVAAPGVLILPLQREFGWSTADISLALALRLLLFGLMGPFAAALMNRFGVRRVALVALALMGTGLLLSSLITAVWQLVVFWGIVLGIGTGLTAMVMGATVATRWFTERRGLVIGLLTASAATGQMVFLPLLAGLGETYGWRSAVVFTAAVLAVVAVVVLLLMRDRPSDLGLRPYGETGPAAAPAAPPPPAFESPFAILREASGSATFWVLFATFFICGVSTAGLIQTHFIPLCADYGLPAVGAAGVLAFMGLFNVAGTVASGWLSDRFDNRWLLFTYYGLRGLSLVYLPFTDFTFYGLTIFAVFYGLDWIATVPPTVKLAAARFGRERSNLVFGWIFAGHQIGAAAAALAAGFTRDTFATYLPAFFVAGLLCFLAAGLAITLAAPKLAPAAPVPGPA